ncbi:MAG TPA: acetate--CoA ligase [Candidatus Limnocylindria bacterium]|nr:acetate--CoA ligase [Candidatus Limnocylindria bacterium]
MTDSPRAQVEAWQRRALEDPERFWREAAAGVAWFTPPEHVFEQPDPPSFRWFGGGTTNIAHNALDRHVSAGRGDHPALIARNERGERRQLTYAELLAEVDRIAAALRASGVQRGDRVTIYMPTCVESIAAMLAVVRIGAIHSVVFAGFGAGALRDRIVASGSRLLLTADVTYRKGRDVALTPIVAAALEGETPVERVVILRRDPHIEAPSSWTAWDAFLEAGGEPAAPEAMGADEPAFVIATSGTTARPKLAVHGHGGYQVYATAMGRWIFDLRPEDRWWCTSDIGWIVGHAYMVHVPLIVGATTIAYEGALDHPDAEAPWRLVEEERVTGLFSSPTAIRSLMRHGNEPPAQHDLSTVTRAVSAGEVLNAPAWEWLSRDVFGDRIPVIDHMWQTETGGPIFGNPLGVARLPIKPGSAGVALAGVDAAVVDRDGHPVPPGTKGIMTIRRPFPGLIATLWGEPQRYVDDYWSRVPGQSVYYVGDAAHVDEDGYVWFAGRADEIIKIAAHRIGTIEVETALLRHPAVAEAGVTGRPDELRGEVIAAFVVLKAGHAPSDALRAELLAAVRDDLGPVAVIGELTFVSMLPKTRSGKIMRRVLRAVVLGTDPGDITTIEDEGSVEEAREALVELRGALRS